MTTANYLDRFLAPMTEALTPEVARTLANLKIDDELQARINDLAEKANEGTITPEEDSDYKRMIDAADILGVIQLKARRFLAQHPA